MVKMTNFFHSSTNYYSACSNNFTCCWFVRGKRYYLSIKWHEERQQLGVFFVYQLKPRGRQRRLAQICTANVIVCHHRLFLIPVRSCKLSDPEIVEQSSTSLRVIIIEDPPCIEILKKVPVAIWLPPRIPVFLIPLNLSSVNLRFPLLLPPNKCMARQAPCLLPLLHSQLTYIISPNIEVMDT